MPLSAAAVVHGTVDPSWASRVATDFVSPAQTMWTEPERTFIYATRDDLKSKLATEVNRIEGAFTLMLSHVEGQYQSTIALLKLRSRWIPAVAGFVVGLALATFVFSFYK
jgi:hypothetical protein